MITFYTILTILTSILYAEIIGYFVHILLHSEKVKYLSYSHMLHHIRDYGRHKPFLTGKYIASSRDRASFLGGIGMEWFVPFAVIACITFLFFYLVSMPLYVQIVFLITSVTWGYIGFNYMHSAMHIKGFWMEKNFLFKNWFKKLRMLHSIHHNNLNQGGQMVTNYGICFFFLDRLLSSYVTKYQDKEENSACFEACRERYSYLLNH